MARTITLECRDECAACGASLAPGTRARLYGNGAVYGFDCHQDTRTPEQKQADRVAARERRDAWRREQEQARPMRVGFQIPAEARPQPRPVPEDVQAASPNAVDLRDLAPGGAYAEGPLPGQPGGPPPPPTLTPEAEETVAEAVERISREVRAERGNGSSLTDLVKGLDG